MRVGLSRGLRDRIGFRVLVNALVLPTDFHLDVNAVGDFVDMASMLIEIKSRMVLPRGGEIEDELEDPRQELVHRLLEYKKFKDALAKLVK